jgi:NAD(P)-dependent dehydrogenase (short-subunit alcohol dehydrogenase family)
MGFDFTCTVVLFTGGTRGAGHGIAWAFAGAATVVVAARSGAGDRDDPVGDAPLIDAHCE